MKMNTLTITNRLMAENKMTRWHLIMIFPAALACGCVSSPKDENHPASEHVIRDLLSAPPTPSGENCAFRAPPKEARPYILPYEKQFVFMYPAATPPHYTGCQIIWNQKGYKVHLLHFEQGTPDVAEKYMDNKLLVACNIKNQKEKTSAQCPGREAFDLLKRKSAFKGRVPHERDPRRSAV